MISRRDLLRDAAALTASLGLAPAAVWASAHGRSADRGLAMLCDLVIPGGETPGAIDAGVPDFVHQSITLGLRGATPAAYAAFRGALDTRAGAPFESLEPARAQTLLAGVDASAFPGGPPGPPPSEAPTAIEFWRTLKALIVIGYYTSEIGASRELRYELVPGRYEPDIALTEDPRGYSSDWDGVRYA